MINLVMLLITTVQSLPNGHHNTWSASTSLTEADATASSEFTTANVKEAVGMQTLGSSGARAGDTGAASSFGLGPGGGGSSNAAAGPDASSVVSMGNAGYSEVSSTVGHAGRDKRLIEAIFRGLFFFRKKINKAVYDLLWWIVRWVIR